ncbi:hypothetical protein MOA67_gp200 [Klebsiella phage KpLz-2_45]|uniref:hypothetical protein n=1 Tax=Klebsiella phage KpLz-2_45 TaxID=2698923 RepID=UPI001F12E030|nr:hypothetical protein MOA67_gp200 [Klebsiella phage KpLz-2_45]UKS72066.1 hypothetical protein KpLz245_2000 [Klebsiella phage KpLz-2_45]
MDCPMCQAMHCSQVYDEDDNEITWECRECKHFWLEPIDAEKPTRTELNQRRNYVR